MSNRAYTNGDEAQKLLNPLMKIGANSRDGKIHFPMK